MPSPARPGWHAGCNPPHGRVRGASFSSRTERNETNVANHERVWFGEHHVSEVDLYAFSTGVYGPDSGSGRGRRDR